jgi:hypothetical protein
LIAFDTGGGILTSSTSPEETLEIESVSSSLLLDSDSSGENISIGEGFETGMSLGFCVAFAGAVRLEEAKERVPCLRAEVVLLVFDDIDDRYEAILSTGCCG